jgi:hypothetical protein
VSAALDDHRLVIGVAQQIGVPRAAVADRKGSFVLHAPLELMARAALLPYVAPAARDAARARIETLGAAYEASGPPVAAPRPQDYRSPADALRQLAAAVEREELDDVDAAADWLGTRCRPDELVSALADVVVDRLSAAGHGNIYLALLGRTQPRGLPGQMLRHPARELATASQHRIAVPGTTSVGDRSGMRTRELLDVLTRVDVVDPPSSLFIAPMVEHAQAHGAFDGLLDDDGRFRAPAAPPFALLRFAAQAMLQGPAAQAPFGWTHCLTLSQAPLLVASAGSDPARAVFVAAAYLAAHWATQGEGHVDLDLVPPPTGAAVAEALDDSFAAAAAAAWHATDPDATVAVLATSAATAHDAHRVKYTLACIDAAAADPTHRSTYLAAAAYLNAWWNSFLRGRPDDDAPAIS